jgi:predicted nucleic acid-binding protein
MLTLMRETNKTYWSLDEFAVDRDFLTGQIDQLLHDKAAGWWSDLKAAQLESYYDRLDQITAIWERRRKRVKEYRLDYPKLPAVTQTVG